MAYKLADSFIRFLDVERRNHRQFLLISQFSYFILRKSRFCSKNDENKSPPLGEEKVKELLKLSSPLKLSAELDVDSDLWATTPYPEGTVFRESASDIPDDFENQSSRDLSTKSIFLFPGQGNQFVGMGKNLMKYPNAIDMFERASHILNYDLKKICFDGPENLLNDTKYCQPATFVCSLALLEKIKDEKPWAIDRCIAACGYSLGELTALVFSGCVSFETGLKLVKVRAKLMAECCKKTPGGMLTIFTGPLTKLGVAFEDAINHCKKKGIENPVCATASYLYTNCKVLGGNIEALKFLAENATTYGIKRHSFLPVSGAFHTELMKEAADSFGEKLSEVVLQKPFIKIFSNVTGKPYSSEKVIKKLLKKQIYSPVRWEQTVQNLIHVKKGIPFFYECGPGSSLIATVKKINQQATPKCSSVRM